MRGCGHIGPRIGPARSRANYFKKPRTPQEGHFSFVGRFLSHSKVALHLGHRMVDVAPTAGARRGSDKGGAGIGASGSFPKFPGSDRWYCGGGAFTHAGPVAPMRVTLVLPRT